MRRLKREPTENKATKELRKAILSGSLPPGSRLRQEELAGLLGVSRMPVRQAFAALQSEGLVKTDPWRGTIVAPLEREAIHDMYTFRSILERHVAAALADRRDFNPSFLRDVIANGIDALAKGNLAGLIELDLRFHTHLYEAFGNRMLLDVMRGQWTHMRRVMAVTLTIDVYRNRVWDEHAGILKAIEAHDTEEAGTLAEAHTTAALGAVMKNLDAHALRAAQDTK
jgi:DNA-binding GntR family transcriptional regulator